MFATKKSREPGGKKVPAFYFFPSPHMNRPTRTNTHTSINVVNDVFSDFFLLCNWPTLKSCYKCYMCAWYTELSHIGLCGAYCSGVMLMYCFTIAHSRSFGFWVMLVFFLSVSAFSFLWRCGWDQTSSPYCGQRRGCSKCWARIRRGVRLETFSATTLFSDTKVLIYLSDWKR